MDNSDVLALHINGCEYFTQTQVARVGQRLVAGTASAEELQQIVAIQMRQIQLLVDEKRKTDAEMREIRQTQRQLIAAIKRGNNGRMAQFAKDEMPIPTISLTDWYNTWGFSAESLEQVSKNGMLYGFKICVATAISAKSVDLVLPMSAFKDNKKVYVYNANLTPVWHVLCEDDIMSMFRRFRHLMKMEWCRWEEANQEYLYNTDEGLEESANLQSKIFGELAKREIKGLCEFMYRKLSAIIIMGD
jgi:hypothetical protein